MTVSVPREVFAGVGEGGAATVKAIGVMYMLTAGLQRGISSLPFDCRVLGGLRYCTVSLSQLIQRGITILVKVITHAVEH